MYYVFAEICNTFEQILIYLQQYFYLLHVPCGPPYISNTNGTQMLLRSTVQYQE